MKFLLLHLVCILWFSFLNAQDSLEFVEVFPNKGEGIYHLLERFGLYDNGCERAKFYELNGLSPQDNLFQHIKYKLPLLVSPFDGNTIRTSLSIHEFSTALEIQTYNEFLIAKNLKELSYQQDNTLWVPMRFNNCRNAKNTSYKDFVEIPLLGEKYKRVDIVSQNLSNKVIYIVSGHGGPDPGAIANIGSHQICEDEYAYDVALRLYRNVLSHGGIAYMIIQDPLDGIRDEKILLCDKNEVTIHQKKIERDQVLRLRQRVDEINSLYHQHKDPKLEHIVIAIHLDSRKETLQQDIFFFHDPRSVAGKQLAIKIQETFGKKYSIHRPQNQYKGTVSSRSLYVLKNTIPPAVFLELGNMQNHQNRKRFLEPDNRQAMANWITEAFFH
jgi:N-acetylmuramoyl-L-alanine amidase